MIPNCLFIGGPLDGKLIKVDDYTHWSSTTGEIYRRERISVPHDTQYTDVFLMEGLTCMTAIQSLIKRYRNDN
jgi:hypothetical protein